MHLHVALVATQVEAEIEVLDIPNSEQKKL